MLCLLEASKYDRGEAAFNMRVDPERLPADPGSSTVASERDRDELAGWLDTHWSFWRAEAQRALDKGTLVIERDEQGVSAFCAYDVNRRGLLGPVAVRPDLMGRGRGVGVLVHALHRMRDAGHPLIEVSWVGPIVPYARVGAVISRVFFVYRKARR
jgi:hypothetical protein